MSRPPEPLASATAAAEWSPEERRILLDTAHRAIESAAACRKFSTDAPTPHLAAPRGAFTTIHLHGQLRGCVGYVAAMYPLYRTIAETAVAAAFTDPRFLPVTLDEAPHLKVEISVLSPLSPIRPEEIEIGRHGLVVALGMRRGLLLPQVPVEWGWDVKTFLQQTCMKAGLPPDAGQRGAELQGFTAEIFHDPDFQ